MEQSEEQPSAEPEQQQASKEEVGEPAAPLWPIIDGENVDAQPTHEREREREYGAFAAPAAYSAAAVAPTAATVRSDKQDPARTVFVGGIPGEATDDLLRATFAQHGAVETARVIYDRITSRSKGFAFVTFAEERDAMAVRALGKVDFMGRTVDVGTPGQRTGAAAIGPAMPPHLARQQQQQAGPAGGDRKVFIGNVPKEADEAQLQWFLQSTWGAVEEVKLVKDHATGGRKGYGFVMFAERASAEALKAARSAEFMGRTMNFGEATHAGQRRGADAGGMAAAAAAAAMVAAQQGWMAQAAWGAAGGYGAPQAMPQYVFDPMTGQYTVAMAAPQYGMPAQYGGMGMAAMGMGMGALSGAYDPYGGQMGAPQMGVPQAPAPSSIQISLSAAGGQTVAVVALPDQFVLPMTGTGGQHLNAIMGLTGCLIALKAREGGAGRCLEMTGSELQVAAAQQIVTAIYVSLGPQQPPETEPGSKIFLGGLPSGCEVASLVTLFTRWGPVASAKVPTDPATGRSKGFGFVTFCEAASAAAARASGSVELEGKIVEIKEPTKSARPQ